MKTESHQFVTNTLPNQNPLTTKSKNHTFWPVYSNWPKQSTDQLAEYELRTQEPTFFFDRKATALSSQSVSAWPFFIGLGWGMIELKTKSQV